MTGALMAASPLCRLSGRVGLAVVLTTRHHGDAGQLVGQRHHRDVEGSTLQQSGKDRRENK